MNLFSSPKRQTVQSRLRSGQSKGSSTLAASGEPESSSPLPEAGSSSQAATASPPPRPPRRREPSARAESERSWSDERPEDDELFITCHPPEQEPSFSFVCLGVGGGPLESDCSCYIVKAADRHWREGMYVLEGGSWLGALSRVCSEELRKAFYDFDFSHSDASLRAGEIGSYAKAFLISHAHLDHILGMVLGSASLPGKRAVYGLKSTLDNLLGIFDGKLWPKLASFREEDPFIVYHLKPVESQTVLTLDDSISVLPFALSHGLSSSSTNLPAPPTPTPSSTLAPRGSYFNKRFSLPLNSLTLPPRQADGSFASLEKPVFTSPFAPNVQPTSAVPAGRGDASGATSPSPSDSSYHSSVAPDSESPASTAGSFAVPESQRPPVKPMTPVSQDSAPPPPPPAATRLKSSLRPKTASGSERAAGKEESGPEDAVPRGRRAGAPRRVSIDNHSGALDSTAFFLTNKRTGNDVLFFGDVEPDCVSRAPRNKRIWQHTASRFAVGKLTTMFLECSFPAAHPTEFLWGHLSVNHLYDELRVLARCVKSERAVLARRNKVASGGAGGGSRNGNAGSMTPSMVPPSPLSAPDSAELRGTLAGLNVVIIHVKQALFPSVAEDASKSTDSSATGSSGGGRVLDPRTMQQRILQELEELDVENGLGVRFIIAKQGMRLEI